MSMLTHSNDEIVGLVKQWLLLETVLKGKSCHSLTVAFFTANDFKGAIMAAARFPQQHAASQALFDFLFWYRSLTKTFLRFAPTN
jgi:hypothetical protein